MRTEDRFYANDFFTSVTLSTQTNTETRRIRSGVDQQESGRRPTVQHR